MDILLTLGGLAALLAGGEFLVGGAVALAARAGISPMIIGLTLVGFGTSAPELVTSLQAAFSGSDGIAIGNVVGSNIANVLLILGIAAVVRPMVVDRASLPSNILWLGTATALAVALGLLDGFGRLAGIVLLLGLTAFLVVQFRAARAAPEGEAQPVTLSVPRASLTFLGGLILTLLGARWLVAGATGIARDFGVPETVIGLTLVAVGTSLPELVTSVAAARRGQGDVALGNIFGSNIFNILGILGITAVVHPLDTEPAVFMVDLGVMAAAAVVLALVCKTGLRVTRTEGALMLAAYGAYMLWLSRTLT